jgi:hypothetical protein
LCWSSGASLAANWADQAAYEADPDALRIDVRTGLHKSLATPLAGLMPARPRACLASRWAALNLGADQLTGPADSAGPSTADAAAAAPLRNQIACR